MSELSPRFALPLLEAGQAQKEIVHNEAITLLEALVQPVAETLGDSAPPATPIAGRSWIVGAGPGGDWAGQAHAVATWTEGGWRFVAPIEGMSLWVAASSLCARWRAGAWELGVARAAALSIGGDQVVAARQPAIADPAGGTSADAPARAAVTAILAALRNHGLISS